MLKTPALQASWQQKFLNDQCIERRAVVWASRSEDMPMIVNRTDGKKALKLCQNYALNLLVKRSVCD